MVDLDKAIWRIAGMLPFLYASSPYSQDGYEEAALQRGRGFEQRSRKQESLEAPVTPAQERLIERAAALRGNAGLGWSTLAR